MSNKIICNRVECAPLYYFYVADTDGLLFKTGKSFEKLESTSKISYRKEVVADNNGSITKEVISISMASGNHIALDSPAKDYILKIFTPTSEIIVGSVNFPCRKSYLVENGVANITFERNSFR